VCPDYIIQKLLYKGDIKRLKRYFYVGVTEELMEVEEEGDRRTLKIARKYDSKQKSTLFVLEILHVTAIKKFCVPKYHFFLLLTVIG